MHGLNPPIIHRDLKSPNILMTSRGPNGEKLKWPMPKIADFGLSRGMQWTSSMSDKAVDNPVWLAPEIMCRKPYNEKADVYSFGVILYEIVLQLRFLEDIKFDYQKEDAIKSGTRPNIPADVNPILSSLIHFCWAQEPNQRPSFDQIVECLETKTIIKSAKPSILNYGTGFEDFDVAEVPSTQSRSQLVANLAPVPGPTPSDTPGNALPKSPSPSPLNSARSGSVEAQGFLGSARASGQLSNGTFGSSTPTSSRASSSRQEEEYAPLPVVDDTNTSRNSTSGRKGGWSFATPQRSDSHKNLVEAEHSKK